jgi:hypothetical protein
MIGCPKLPVATTVPQRRASALRCLCCSASALCEEYIKAQSMSQLLQTIPCAYQTSMCLWSPAHDSDNNLYLINSNVVPCNWSARCIQPVYKPTPWGGTINGKSMSCPPLRVVSSAPNLRLRYLGMRCERIPCSLVVLPIVHTKVSLTVSDRDCPRICTLLEWTRERIENRFANDFIAPLR